MHIWPSNHSHLQFTKPFVDSLKTVPSGPFKTAPPSSVNNSLIIQESQNLSEQDAPVSLPIVTTSVARWETAGATPSQARNRPLSETSLPEVRAHHDLGKDDDDDDDSTFNTLNDPGFDMSFFPFPPLAHPLAHHHPCPTRHAQFPPIFFSAIAFSHGVQWELYREMDYWG